MRAVTRAAGLSVSAANYHFGSKEALVREALLRALGPLSAERLERVEALEAAARVEGRTPGVEELVEAFLRPAFALRSRERESGGSPSRSYRLLWARLHLGNSQVAEEVKHELLNPAFRRYLDALARSLPDRDREDLALAFQLALGSALHVLGGHAEQLADLEPLEDEALLGRLVRFAAAGIRAASRSGPGDAT
jgi:AcrR family transcriptional regulator